MIKKDEFLKEMQNSRLRKIKELLVLTLSNAEDEENCTDKENEMYTNMENLRESIEKYMEEENNGNQY